MGRKVGDSVSRAVVVRQANHEFRNDRLSTGDEARRVSSDPVQALIAKWTNELERHRSVPAFLSGEHIVLQVLRDLEVMRQRKAETILSLAEASAECGYSQAHLGRLVRSGTIPDRRPEGGRGRLWFFRSDLPRKPAAAWVKPSDLAGLEDLLKK